MLDTNLMNDVHITEDAEMFKQLITLARGRSEDATQALMDSNALLILRQQMRDAAAGVQHSRKSLAIVMAYAEREKASLERLKSQLNELETRALAALGQDREDLAIEASEAIAHLEAEAAAARKARDTYSREITRLRKILRDSETRLKDLKRGQRLAEANDKTLRMQGATPPLATSDLDDASKTLQRLKNRQDHAAATAAALSELSVQENADTVNDRLAEAGCGAARQSDAAAVLARLKAATKP
jgi:phage shock protein A